MTTSNSDWPHGFFPAQDAHGGIAPARLYPTRIGAGGTVYATAIYKGAPVGFDATNRCVKAISTTNTTNILGFAAEYVPASASSVLEMRVWRADAGTEFIAQLDNATAITNIGSLLQQNFPITGVDDGNTNSGISSAEVDHSGKAAINKIITVVAVESEAGGRRLGPNAKVRCIVNEGHLYSDATTGV